MEVCFVPNAFNACKENRLRVYTADIVKGDYMSQIITEHIGVIGYYHR